MRCKVCYNRMQVLEKEVWSSYKCIKLEVLYRCPKLCTQPSGFHIKKKYNRKKIGVDVK